MIKQIKSTVSLASVVLGLVIATASLGAQLPGAIFTTDSTCSGVNLNIYTNKGDVYIDGGPAHPGAASLPDVSYYVQVTNPGGDVVLGSSGASTPFVVLNGITSVVQSYMNDSLAVRFLTNEAISEEEDQEHLRFGMSMLQDFCRTTRAGWLLPLRVALER